MAEAKKDREYLLDRGVDGGGGRLLPGAHDQEGTPAIQTTVRYTQVSREEVKEKLKSLGG